VSVQVRLDYHAKPSFLGFMAQMWRPKGRFDAAQGLPDMLATWRGQRSSPRELADFFELSGLPAGATSPSSMRTRRASPC
jgi:hypothetical protein